MTTLPYVPLTEAQVEAFCRRWKIVEMGVFGSAVRGELRPDSDIDFLVTFEPEADLGFHQLFRIEEELASLVGRPVDIVTRRSVEASQNYIRRQSILSSVVPLYVREG
jgi:hypothetical protein